MKSEFRSTGTGLVHRLLLPNMGGSSRIARPFGTFRGFAAGTGDYRTVSFNLRCLPVFSRIERCAKAELALSLGVSSLDLGRLRRIVRAAFLSIATFLSVATSPALICAPARELCLQR